MTDRPINGADPTENMRRARIEEQRLEIETAVKRDLEAKHGEVLNTVEMTTHYEVEGFAAPYVVVTRKRDHQRGSLEFTHSPRFYFGFRKDT